MMSILVKVFSFIKGFLSSKDKQVSVVVNIPESSPKPKRRKRRKKKQEDKEEA